MCFFLVQCTTVKKNFVQDPTSPNRQVAVRIKYLPKGTITLEQYLPEKYFGTVEKEAGSLKNAGEIDFVCSVALPHLVCLVVLFFYYYYYINL